MRAIVLVLALSSLILSGCGVMYRSAAEDFMRTQPASAWGKPPPANHNELEKNFILGLLKDPNSAMISFGEPTRIVTSASALSPQVVPVWASPVYVNARNSFGGYTGRKRWLFCYQNGKLHSLERDGDGTIYFPQK